MGRRLEARGVLPDTILASPAKRARSTARKIARALGFDRDAIREEPAIYDAELAPLLDVVHTLDPQGEFVSRSRQAFAPAQREALAKADALVRDLAAQDVAFEACAVRISTGRKGRSAFVTSDESVPLRPCGWDSRLLLPSPSARG